VCSPSRAALFTGRYQQRFGHEFNPAPAAVCTPNFGLALSEPTLPQRLKELGYATGMFGKWHLGYRPEHQPQSRGFDEFFGFLGGQHSYLSADKNSANPILNGTAVVEDVDYTTDMFGRQACAFIRTNQDRPFFVCLSFNAVHMPLEATTRYESRFAHILDERRRTYAAMLAALDDNVGHVLKTLRDGGIERDTLLIFLSDNGGPTPKTTSRNLPLRGFKTQTWEGGIRVPFMMKWPGHVSAGRTNDWPVSSLDVLPTAVAAAGGHLSPGTQLDGVDLMPCVTARRSAAPHDRLFWRFGDRTAARLGDWKIVKMPGSGIQLFNIVDDVSETTNLAAREPARLMALTKAWQEWNGQLAAPRWNRVDETNLEGWVDPVNGDGHK
jgi:arylsulfatase A-like enzyme